MTAQLHLEAVALVQRLSELSSRQPGLRVLRLQIRAMRRANRRFWRCRKAA